MSSDYQRALSRSRREQARGTRRGRFVGFLVLMVVGAAALYANGVLLRSSDQRALDRGLEAFAQAIAGDVEAFDQADNHLREALSLAAFDPFAIYVLDLTERFRGGSVPAVDPKLVPALEALRRGDRVGARVAAMAVPETPPQRFLLRLLNALDAAGAQKN